MGLRANACPRCLTLRDTRSPDGVHTCTPTVLVRDLEAKIVELEAQVKRLTQPMPRGMERFRADLVAGVLEIHIPMADEAGGVVKLHRGGSITLHEIPQFGGEERYVQHCPSPSVLDAIDIVKSWT